LEICNATLKTGIAPVAWTTSAIVPLYKKGDPQNPSNYRGIALSSTAAKLFDKLLLLRLREIVEPLLRDTQNGLQHILALRKVIEHASLHQDQSLLVCFVDFHKAFDSVDRRYLLDTLREYFVPPYLIRAVMSLYANSTARIVTSQGLTESIPLYRGVLQGDTLAPYLFVMVLDRVMRLALDFTVPRLGIISVRRNGSRQMEQRVTDLTFADDIALLASSFEDGQKMLDALAAAAAPAGLTINAPKTKVMVSAT
jgi:Reverse transcriptase (RNA-dependent DNA polymerase)